MKSKLARFKIISERDNVLEPGKEIYFSIKGKWNELYFKNKNPITVELACGRGEYTIGLARKYSQRNFIGVDMKGDRIWKGSTWAVEQSLANVAFLRAQILTIENFFDKGEVDELWLTFPDPRPRKRDIKRRLTHPRFLDLYKYILKDDGVMKFKTDNTDLFDYTLEVLQAREDIIDLAHTHNLYQEEALKHECYDIKTKYEEMFTKKGETIKYLRFKFVL